MPSQAWCFFCDLWVYLCVFELFRQLPKTASSILFVRIYLLNYHGRLPRYVAQRCRDPSLMNPHNTLPCCLFLSLTPLPTKYFKGQCLTAKAKGLVWFLSSLSMLWFLSLSSPFVCFPVSSSLSFLLHFCCFSFYSPPSSLFGCIFTYCFSLWDCWKDKLSVMDRIRGY